MDVVIYWRTFILSEPFKCHTFLYALANAKTQNTIPGSFLCLWVIREPPVGAVDAVHGGGAVGVGVVAAAVVVVAAARRLHGALVGGGHDASLLIVYSKSQRSVTVVVASRMRHASLSSNGDATFFGGLVLKKMGSKLALK